MRNLTMYLLCLSAAPLIAGEAFATKPSVQQVDGKATVAFAVAAPTDAEVAILDAKGVVVRHLAAGVLGGKDAPPAPLKAGLAQSLVWDGMDDWGTAAKGGPFKARVRLGMGTKMEAIAGGDPYAFWSEESGQGDHTQWSIAGLEAKADGSVYLLGSVTPFGLPALRRYDARGDFRATVFPPPPSLTAADVQGWGVNSRADGSWTLRHTYGWMSTLGTYSLICEGRDSGAIWWPRLIPSPDKDSLTAASPLWTGNQRVSIGTDGSLRQGKPEPFLAGEPLPKKDFIDLFFTAVSPDGKSLYLSGCGSPSDPFWRDGRVWKIDVATRVPSIFFELGEDERKDRSAIGLTNANPYTAFHGVAVDGAGRVFIADRQSKRIAVVGADGKLIRSVPVMHADAVAVGRTSKALYVTTRIGTYNGDGELRLLKFADWPKDDAPATVVPLRSKIGKRREGSLLAVVEDKGETLVWVAYTQLPVRIYKDAGKGLELLKDFYQSGPQQRALDLQHMEVDQATGDIYIADSQNCLFRLRDWKKPVFEPCLADAKTRIEAGSLAIDARSRLLYTKHHYRNPIRRWRMDGEFFTPVPAGASQDIAPAVTASWVFTGLWERGMAAHPGGLATLGVVLINGARIDDYSGPLTWFKADAANGPWQGLPFAGFGSKASSSGIRFDPRGNLYAGVIDGPPSSVPAGFEKDPDYTRVTGRIHRFAPTGSLASGNLFPSEPKPAKVYDVPYGPMNSLPRFGVDAYGRIYYPNGRLPQVAVIDNEGNQVLAFGTYGNRDSLGGLPGETVPTRDVPLAWPASVDATDEHIYVSDRLNVRILRLAKTFAAAETVALK